MDQITLLAEDQEDFLVDVQTKESLTLHEEADFVFGMNVFCQEFAPECRPLGMLWVHADRIDSDVAIGRLDSVDFIGIGVENFSLTGPARQASTGRPLLKNDSASPQLLLNGIRVVADAMGMSCLPPDSVALVWKDAQTTHRSDP